MPAYIPSIKLVIASAILIGFATAGNADDAETRGIEFFEKHIRPVLADRCFKCHSAEAAQAKKLKGGLRLDSRETARKGGDTGPAVVAGDLKKSILLSAIRHEDLEMPPKGKLSDDVIARFAKWIEIGAPWPDEATAELAEEEIDWDEARKFWAFRPPRRYEIPAVKKSAWPKKRVDHFVLSQLESAGLQPNDAAHPLTLIRRLTFDLIGLPPNPEEIAAFEAQSSRNPKTAVSELVDRLIASPHYGEHFARLWLDIARYAEDQAHIVGNNKALTYPNAYLYRDWIVQAVNDDVSYDEFLKLQLAADVLHPADDTNYAALGFIGLGPKYYSRGRLEVKADEWEDRVDTVTRGMLGVTVACARCHDHKFDPFETEDYYALAGIFASSEMFNRPLSGDRKKQGGPNAALHVVREGGVKDLNVFIRGNVENKGPVVKRRYLRVLCDGEPQPFSRGSGRLDLAEAIASADNPLTARVIVNRVWGKLLGRPLVATPSNFGSLGARPSHPKLLDDLAVRFVESGWSLKWLHREIVLSATYQQSCATDAAKKTSDEQNVFLSHANRRRLTIEQWRDAILAATGELDDTIGGRSFQADDPNQRRRTLYSRISRLELNKMLALFDFPEPNVHAARRSETTTPLQKLFVLNSEFMSRRAQSLAQLLEKSTAATSKRQALDEAYRRLYGRKPTNDEAELCLEFIDSEQDNWQQLAQVLLAANEMMYLD